MRRLIYVTFSATIPGTPWEASESIDPATVADKFWALHQSRGELRARVG